MPSSINWSSKKIYGLHYSNKRLQTKWFPFPGAVYNRRYGVDRQLLRRIEDIIGRNRCFNHVNHFDKGIIYQLLSKTELNDNLPLTIPYKESNIAVLLEKYGTLYLKPTLGNRGEGVYRVHKAETEEICVSENYFVSSFATKDFDIVSTKLQEMTREKEYIVQQGISFTQVNRKNFDIRVLVQKNDTGLWGATNFISRTAYSGCFNTSVCDSIAPSKQVLESFLLTGSAKNLLDRVATLSLKCARLLERVGTYHLGELSVDFGLDYEGKLWIIEVNGNPQRTLYKELENYQDVYRNPIGYAQFLMSMPS